jgi:hypothetical protein
MCTSAHGLMLVGWGGVGCSTCMHAGEVCRLVQHASLLAHIESSNMWFELMHAGLCI